MRNHTILVIDDDDFYESIIDGMLSQLTSATVTDAHGGKEALQLYKLLSSPPDLIICDIFMPDMDGFDFLDELIALNFTGALMFISGVDPMILSIAEQVGGQNHLRMLGAFEKPLKLSQLSGVLAKLGLLKE